MTVLTAKEIKNLAEFAGLNVNYGGMTPEEAETEFTIQDCPKDGVSCDGGKPQKYSGSVAWISDYPEEGCMPLGDPI